MTPPVRGKTKTTSRTSARGRRAITALCALLLTASCGLATDQQPRPLDANTFPRPSPPATSADTSPGVEPTTLYLVRDGGLVPVVRRAAQQLDPQGVLAALLAGPTLDERLRGLTTAAPIGAKVSGTNYPQQLVTVALDDTQTSSLRTDEVLGYAQLVATLTQLRQISRVEFERNGEPVSVPRADGSLNSGPLTLRDYASLL